MGWLFYLTLERLSLNPTLRTAILTGGLGGFTTFSTLPWKHCCWWGKVQPGPPWYI